MTPPPTPFGTFPKIHPFWKSHPSLIALTIIQHFSEVLDLQQRSSFQLVLLKVVDDPDLDHEHDLDDDHDADAGECVALLSWELGIN